MTSSAVSPREGAKVPPAVPDLCPSPAVLEEGDWSDSPSLRCSRVPEGAGSWVARRAAHLCLSSEPTMQRPGRDTCLASLGLPCSLETL